MNSTIRLVLSTAAALGLFLAPASGSATTPTPSPTPDECVGGSLHFAQLHLELSIEPAHPRVGDDVVLTAKISTVVDGSVGIPQYTLYGTSPFFTRRRRAAFGPVRPGRSGLRAARRPGGNGAAGGVRHLRNLAGLRRKSHLLLSGRVVRTSGGRDRGGSGRHRAPLRRPRRRRSTCVGDCNGDGAVTISEIITGVNIGLSLAPIAACPAFDRNGDESITVDELVAGVQSGLSSCPAANARRSSYCRNLCASCVNCHESIFVWGRALPLSLLAEGLLRRGCDTSSAEASDVPITSGPSSTALTFARQSFLTPPSARPDRSPPCRRCRRRCGPPPERPAVRGRGRRPLSRSVSASARAGSEAPVGCRA